MLHILDEADELGINTPPQLLPLDRQLRDAYLKAFGEQTMNAAGLLEQMDDVCVEDAYRQAGFVVGFEACRQLIMGELDLAALTQKVQGGAR